jgi:signal-transduction protein with cAMP-binding, CBS, and nucleotidyltransferase domain
MLTDRDITVRGVAKGRPAGSTPVSELMSAQPLCCFDDAPLDEAMGRMREAQMRRLPVVDHAGRLVGILSLGDVAASADAPEVAGMLACISESLDPEGSASLSVAPH